MDLRADDKITRVEPPPSEGYRHIPHGGVTTTFASHQARVEKRVLVAGGVVPGLHQFASAELRAGVIIEPHRHATMTEVFHLLEGRLLARCAETELQLTGGNSLVVNAGTEHSFQAQADTRIIYFGFHSGG